MARKYEKTATDYGMEVGNTVVKRGRKSKAEKSAAMENAVMKGAARRGAAVKPDAQQDIMQSSEIRVPRRGRPPKNRPVFPENNEPGLSGIGKSGWMKEGKGPVMGASGQYEVNAGRRKPGRPAASREKANEVAGQGSGRVGRPPRDEARKGAVAGKTTAGKPAAGRGTAAERRAAMGGTAKRGTTVKGKVGNGAAAVHSGRKSRIVKAPSLGERLGAILSAMFDREQLKRFWPLLMLFFLAGILLGMWRGGVRPMGRTSVYPGQPAPVAGSLTNNPASGLPDADEAIVPAPELRAAVAGSSDGFAARLSETLRQSEDRLPMVSAGDFVRPCPGRVSETFGWRRDPQAGTWKLYAGVFLSAPRDTAVVCIAPGKVARVEFDSLYGTLIAVDHGGNWRSLYGYLSNVAAVVGDRVDAGQLLAKTGTGAEGVNGLYFAVYRDGEPVDPQEVIAGL